MGNPFFRDRDTTIRFPENTAASRCFTMHRASFFETCSRYSFFFFLPARAQLAATRASVRSLCWLCKFIGSIFEFNYFLRDLHRMDWFIKRLTWTNIYFPLRVIFPAWYNMVYVRVFQIWRVFLVFTSCQRFWRNFIRILSRNALGCTIRYLKIIKSEYLFGMKNPDILFLIICILYYIYILFLMLC